MSIEALKVKMVQKNMTQEELARSIGVSWSTVQRWLKGKSSPSGLANDKIKQFLRQK